MHLKVSVKLNKTLKTLSSGQKKPKKPKKNQKPQKTQKKTKKPTGSGVPRGDAQDARASPLPPLCIPPPAMCIPPSPAWKAGYEKRWGSGQQEKNASLFTCDLIIMIKIW